MKCQKVNSFNYRTTSVRTRRIRDFSEPCRSWRTNIKASCLSTECLWCYYIYKIYTFIYILEQVKSKRFRDKSIFSMGAAKKVHPLRQFEIDCAVLVVSGFERLLNYIYLGVLVCVNLDLSICRLFLYPIRLCPWSHMIMTIMLLVQQEHRYRELGVCVCMPKWMSWADICALVLPLTL